MDPRLRAVIKPQPPARSNPKPKPRVPGPDEGTRGLFVFVLVAFCVVGSPGLSPPLRGCHRVPCHLSPVRVSQGTAAREMGTRPPGSVTSAAEEGSRLRPRRAGGCVRGTVALTLRPERTRQQPGTTRGRPARARSRGRGQLWPGDTKPSRWTPRRTASPHTQLAPPGCRSPGSPAHTPGPPGAPHRTAGASPPRCHLTVTLPLDQETRETSPELPATSGSEELLRHPRKGGEGRVRDTDAGGPAERARAAK